MTDTLFLLGLFVTFGGLAYVLFALGPSVQTSLFRHSLWRYRDELVDAPVHGHAPEAHPAVEDLIGLLEHMIAEPRRHDLFWMYSAWSTPVPSSEYERPSLDGLSPTMAARLQEIEDTVAILSLRQAALGTPLSAATTFVLFPVVFMTVLRAKSRDLGASFRSGWGDSGPSEPLSAHV